MLEVSIVMVVMLVAVSIFGNTVISTSRQRETNRENAVAAEAARVTIERMMNERFGERFALFNPDPADDPAGPGTGPGNRFPVAGLDAVPEAADGMVGEIILPAVDVGGSWELRETYVDPGLNMPRDLNGDMLQDGLDHAVDYVQLPVLIRLRWLGRSGRRELRVYTQMADYKW